MKISLILAKRPKFKISLILVGSQTTKLFFLKYTVTKMDNHPLMTHLELIKGKLI